jgi:hypothetical protein
VRRRQIRRHRRERRHKALRGDERRGRVKVVVFVNLGFVFVPRNTDHFRGRRVQR